MLGKFIQKYVNTAEKNGYTFFKGSTAQLLSFDCTFRFFAGLYENDAEILTYFKEFSRKITKIRKHDVCKAERRAFAALSKGTNPHEAGLPHGFFGKEW